MRRPDETPLEEHDYYLANRVAETGGEQVLDQDRVVERLSQDSIVSALSSLPDDFRDVVVLVDIGDFSYADAAQILDVPIGTVMSRLHRGRRLLKAKLAEEAQRLAVLRDDLEAGILGAVAGTAVNGARSPRVANTTNISFDRIEAESLLIALDLEGIAVSTGSACSSGTLEPSHVLKAMGLPPHRTQNSIRFSLGASNTQADVERVIAVLPGIVEKLRSLTRAPVRA